MPEILSPQMLQSLVRLVSISQDRVQEMSSRRTKIFAGYFINRRYISHCRHPDWPLNFLCIPDRFNDRVAVVTLRLGTGLENLLKVNGSISNQCSLTFAGTEERDRPALQKTNRFALNTRFFRIFSLLGSHSAIYVLFYGYLGKIHS